ncbi:MAG: ribonuclease P protein component [Candidatus Daviesbacteria bacterium]|nr:ribonuclease P protein component [Candidatus Daviesbacteria bacterium]
MLPKNKRLNLNKDFRWVASGKRIENNLVKMFLKMSPPSDVELPQPKIGISLSKNVFKKAVDRNRARRLVSKALENLYNELPSGLNIVAMPKKDILEMNSNEITKNLEELLKKVW